MAIVESSEILFSAISLCGAAYLVWIGLKALMADQAGPLDLGKARKVSIWHACMEGGMISLLNPKIAIFFLALFSQFIGKNPSITDQAIMVMTASLVDGFWYSFVAVILSHGRVLKALQKRSQVINRVTGMVFIMLALRILIP